jgi:hypothetical protein
VTETIKRTKDSELENDVRSLLGLRLQQAVNDTTRKAERLRELGIPVPKDILDFPDHPRLALGRLRIT